MIEPVSKPYVLDEETAAPGDWLKAFGYLLTDPDKARCWLHNMPDVWRVYQAARLTISRLEGGETDAVFLAA